MVTHSIVCFIQSLTISKGSQKIFDTVLAMFCNSHIWILLTYIYILERLTVFLFLDTFLENVSFPYTYTDITLIFLINKWDTETYRKKQVKKSSIQETLNQINSIDMRG